MNIIVTTRFGAWMIFRACDLRLVNLAVELRTPRLLDGLVGRDVDVGARVWGRAPPTHEDHETGNLWYRVTAWTISWNNAFGNQWNSGELSS